MERRWMRAAFLAVLAAVSSLAAAQGIGGSLLTIVVPFPPGGPTDLVARAFATELGAALGTKAIVDNRGGAGGTIGTAVVAKSAPDGQTLLFQSASHTINGSLYSKLPYDPVKDFTGVATVATSGYYLVTSATIPAKTVGEFIAYAKSQQGKLNYASSGIGSASHLAMAYFASLAGIEMLHVPFKGLGPAQNEVLAGRSHAVITTSVSQYAGDDRVRLLGSTSRTRTKAAPKVPTIAESGLAGYEFDTWFGLLAPAATPAGVVTRINAEVKKLLADPAVIERFAKQGVEPMALTSEEFNQLLATNFTKMAEVVRISGAKAD